jgi:O-acetylhomoserine (thiol)-lyase
LKAGAGPDVVRLSVGIETAADLIDDLERALKTV